MLNGRRLTLADRLTLLRLLLVPPLWMLALLEQRTLLGIGVAIAGLTDVLDGPIARRQRRASRLGSQLDSVADLAIITSVTIWLILLRPDFFQARGTILLVWAALGIITLLVGWVRFRRIANLHLYSAKTAGFIGYCFAIYLLVLDGLNAVFFWIAMGAAFVGSLETLLVLATRARVDEHGGSILAARRVKRARSDSS